MQTYDTGSLITSVATACSMYCEENRSESLSPVHLNVHISPKLFKQETSIIAFTCTFHLTMHLWIQARRVFNGHLAMRDKLQTNLQWALQVSCPILPTTGSKRLHLGCQFAFCLSFFAGAACISSAAFAKYCLDCISKPLTQKPEVGSFE